MTTATFNYINPSSFDLHATEPFKNPWNKVDGPGKSYGLIASERRVLDLREQTSAFTLDSSGFSVCYAPSKKKDFSDDKRIREEYCCEIEALLRQQLAGVKKIVIFDHTVRRSVGRSSRRPVQLVHIDQTPVASVARVRRHLPENEAEKLLKGRFQIVNIWRPIQYPATDMPLAVIDWRSIAPTDLVKVDLLYPQNNGQPDAPPSPESAASTSGYEVKGEQFVIVPSEGHRYYYMKDMTPDEALLIKCFDSKSGLLTDGETDIAHGSAHAVFVDPLTAPDAPERQSIEVRCLIFFD